MKIVWTREALERLMEIEDYISRKSPERAAEYVDGIIRRVEAILPGNPCVGRIVPEISLPDFREIILDNYRVVYRIRKDTPEILTVFEGYRLLRNGEIDL